LILKFKDKNGQNIRVGDLIRTDDQYHLRRKGKDNIYIVRYLGQLGSCELDNGIWSDFDIPWDGETKSLMDKGTLTFIHGEDCEIIKKVKPFNEKQVDQFCAKTGVPF